MIFKRKIKYMVSVDAFPPVKHYENDAGWDLCLPKSYVYNWFDQDPFIDTGVHFQIPKGMFGLLTARSSLTKAGAIVPIGIIDADYIGSVKAKVHRIPQGLKAGDRFCQIIFLPLPAVQLVRAKKLSTTGRGFAGFGSTDKPQDYVDQKKVVEIMGNQNK